MRSRLVSRLASGVRLTTLLFVVPALYLDKIRFLEYDGKTTKEEKK